MAQIDAYTTYQSPELQQAQQEMLNAFNELQTEMIVKRAQTYCFDKCVARPGPELLKHQGDCMRNCTSVWLEAQTIVVGAWHDYNQKAILTPDM
mmetsp:Transcript_14636/g.16244  ORF Transcript_14636/g.16244 Transcript_14636/m.16244 type:complete len:94 (+) Transcript_14636:72-353(+)